MKMVIEKHDEELLEQLYWEFDQSRKSGDERLKFKGKLRWYASKYAETLERKIVELEETNDALRHDLKYAN